MNDDLVTTLSIKAGWAPIPGYDFNNSLQEIYNQKLVTLVLQECYQWAQENGGLGSPVDLEELLIHFGLKP